MDASSEENWVYRQYCPCVRDWDETCLKEVARGHADAVVTGTEIEANVVNPRMLAVDSIDDLRECPMVQDSKRLKSAPMVGVLLHDY